MGNSIPFAALVGDDLSQEHGDYKWSDCVAASDGCIYGIPSHARHVIQFNPKDISSTTFGDDLGDGEYKWDSGVEAGNGCIYAVPSDEDCLLKIDTRRKSTIRLFETELPESNVSGLRWGGGALAEDGCLYFFPCNACKILKIDPTNDTASSVGDDLGPGIGKYNGTVKTEDGSLVGIPFESKQVRLFNPKSAHTTTMVGKEAAKDFNCVGNGALGTDGNVYFVDAYGAIIQIDVANNRHSIVAKNPQSTEWGWYGAVAASDGNIHFIPYNASHVMQYDITTQQASFVKGDVGNGKWKYVGGAISPSDGKIYSLPLCADRVLCITTEKKINSGGAISPSDGKIYCLPLKADRVICIATANTDATKKKMDSTSALPPLLPGRKHVFMSHNWGRDGRGRDNHQRVGQFNQALKNDHGLDTWYDEVQMQDNIYERMSEGIENSATVIVFITKEYIDKVRSKGNDNCKFEFNYAVKRKTVDNVIVVLMEDVPASLWDGPVGLTLGNHLWYSFKNDNELETCARDVAALIHQKMRAIHE